METTMIVPRVVLLLAWSAVYSCVLCSLVSTRMSLPPPLLMWLCGRGDTGAMWKGLSDEERKPWAEKSEQLKATGGPGLGLHRKRPRSKNNTGIPGHAPIQPLPPAVQQVTSPASRCPSNCARSVALSRVSSSCL